MHRASSADKKKSGAGRLTYAKGGDGLHHPRVLGRGEGLVCRGQKALLDATTRAKTALDVDLLGSHLDN